MASRGEWIEQIKIILKAMHVFIWVGKMSHLEALILPAVPPPPGLLTSTSPVRLCQWHLLKVILISRLLCIQSTGTTGWAGCPAESTPTWGGVRFLDFGCLGIFLTILQSSSTVSLAGLTNYSSISNGGRWHVWGGCFFWGCGGVVLG